MEKFLVGKIVLVASLWAVSAGISASENWVAGVDYVQINHEPDQGGDISLVAGVGSFGYKLPMSDAFSVVASAHYGSGFNHDGLYVDGLTGEVEIDEIGSLSIRGQVEIIGGLYGFVAPSWYWFKFRSELSDRFVSVTQESESDDFALKSGLGINFTEKASVEVSYTNLNDFEVMSFGFRLNVL